MTFNVPVCGRSFPDAPWDQAASGFNPGSRHMSDRRFYRPLRGFGQEAPADNQVVADDSAWSGTGDPAVAQANAEDDAVGNGIFDNKRRPRTQNIGSGIFAGRYALPGYIYRENPTAPSEVVSSNNGRPIMFLPASGGRPEDIRREMYDFLASEPKPYLKTNIFQPEPTPVSIVSPPVFAEAIPAKQAPVGDVAGSDDTKKWLMLAGAGLALGLLAAHLMKGQK